MEYIALFFSVLMYLNLGLLLAVVRLRGARLIFGFKRSSTSALLYILFFPIFELVGLFYKGKKK